MLDFPTCGDSDDRRVLLVGIFASLPAPGKPLRNTSDMSSEVVRRTWEAPVDLYDLLWT